MLLKNHHHHIHKINFLKDDLGELYIHMVIQAFALSMISLFVPIYLLTLDFPVFLVFLFILFQWVTFSAMAPFAGMFIQKIGIREVILIRTPMVVGAFFLLSRMQSDYSLHSTFLFVAIILGMASSLYTVSITSLFAQVMHREKKGSETGIFVSLPSLGAVFGPAVGGLIAVNFGFASLFMFVSVLLIASVIPLLHIRHNLDHPKFDVQEFMQHLKEEKKTFAMLNLYGLKSFIVFIVLPIVIFLNVKDTLSLGIIISCAALLKIVFTMLLGRYIDGHDSSRIAKVGAWVNTAFLLGVGLLIHSHLIVFMSIVSGFFTIFMDLPIESWLYGNANRSRSPVSYIVFKEFSFLIGRAILFSFLVIASQNIELSFYAGALVTALIPFI
jgi:MFS family permease